MEINKIKIEYVIKLLQVWKDRKGNGCKIIILAIL